MLRSHRKPWVGATPLIATVSAFFQSLQMHSPCTPTHKDWHPDTQRHTRIQTHTCTQARTHAHRRSCKLPVFRHKPAQAATQRPTCVEGAHTRTQLWTSACCSLPIYTYVGKHHGTLHVMPGIWQWIASGLQCTHFFTCNSVLRNMAMPLLAQYYLPPTLALGPVAGV